MLLNGKKNSHPARGANARSPQGYFLELAKLIPSLPYGMIDQIAGSLLHAFAEERTVFVFGNGGSAASASHMMVDLNKGAIDMAGAKRLKVMALTDNVPLLTAWANDLSYEHVFSEQLKSFVRKNDVALAISSSGNSANVLLALRTARERGAVTVGLTGYQGGKMLRLCDVCAVVPSDNVQMIEDMHHAILHSIFSVVRNEFRYREPTAFRASVGGYKNGRSGQ